MKEKLLDKEDKLFIMMSLLMIISSCLMMLVINSKLM